MLPGFVLYLGGGPLVKFFSPQRPNREALPPRQSEGYPIWLGQLEGTRGSMPGLGRPRRLQDAVVFLRPLATCTEPITLPCRRRSPRLLTPCLEFATPSPRASQAFDHPCVASLRIVRCDYLTSAEREHGKDNHSHSRHSRRGSPGAL